MRNRTYTIPYKQNTITQTQLDEIRKEYKEAKALLENTYFMMYCSNRKRSIEEIVAKQLITDVEEQVTHADGKTTRKTISKFPAVDEYKYNAGAYRFIDELYNDINTIIANADDTEQKIKEGTVVVEEDSHDIG